VGRDVPDIISETPSTWQMMRFTEEARANVNYLGAVPYQIKKAYKRQLFVYFLHLLKLYLFHGLNHGDTKAIVASDIGWDG
jgi:hypothetical protein